MSLRQELLRCLFCGIKINFNLLLVNRVLIISTGDFMKIYYQFCRLIELYKPHVHVINSIVIYYCFVIIQQRNEIVINYN